MDAAPFRALRYDPAIAGDPLSTSAPAYDDVGRFTYARHRTVSPYTVLELLTSGEGTDADGYRAAGSSFRRWLRTGVLRQDEQPAFYRYEIHELRHGVPAMLRGVLASVVIDDPDLYPHEEVDAGRVRKRLERLRAVPADLAPLFVVHTPGPPELREALDARPRTPPVIAMTDETGADHRIWALTQPWVVGAVRWGLAQVRGVIADGHHRYGAAAALRRLDPAVDRTMAYLVDGTAYGPELQAVHRLAAPVPDDLEDRLSDRFAIYPVQYEDLPARLTVQRGHAFGLRRRGGRSLVLALRETRHLAAAFPADRPPAWRALDAAVWEHAVRPMLGSAEVTYSSDLHAARHAVDAEPAAALFVLRPPTLEQVQGCAYAGAAMPAKTTWFRPKPRAGLVMRSLQSADADS